MADPQETKAVLSAAPSNEAPQTQQQVEVSESPRPVIQSAPVRRPLFRS